MRQVKMALLVAKPKMNQTWPQFCHLFYHFLRSQISLFFILHVKSYHDEIFWRILDTKKTQILEKSCVLVKIILSMVNSTKWFQSRHIFIVMSFTKGDIETTLRNVSPRQVLRKVPVFGHPGAIEELLIDRICFYLPKGVWRIELELRQPDKCWWGYRFSDILAQ